MYILVLILLYKNIEKNLLNFILTLFGTLVFHVLKERLFRNCQGKGLISLHRLCDTSVSTPYSFSPVPPLFSLWLFLFLLSFSCFPTFSLLMLQAVISTWHHQMNSLEPIDMPGVFLLCFIESIARNTFTSWYSWKSLQGNPNLENSGQGNPKQPARAFLWKTRHCSALPKSN